MKIKIEPYNNKWPEYYLNLKAEIQTLLKNHDIKIEHFGSTAVPGLPAKPVIDILVGISDESEFPDIVESLLSHKSYIYYKVFNDEMPNRRLFVRLRDDADLQNFESI